MRARHVLLSSNCPGRSIDVGLPPGGGRESIDSPLQFRLLTLRQFLHTVSSTVCSFILGTAPAGHHQG